MKRVAIVYSTKYGQTKKIADYIENKLQARGLSTYLINSAEGAAIPAEVDGAIYGGPVYGGKFPKPLVNWVKYNRDRLDQLPAAFFMVSLNAADKRPEARATERKLMEQFIEQSNFAPALTGSFAGALKYREYIWPLRLVMRWISGRSGGSTDTSQNHEYTVWSEVDSFLGAFLSLRNKTTPVVELADRRILKKGQPLSKEEWDQVIL